MNDTQTVTVAVTVGDAFERRLWEAGILTHRLVGKSSDYHVAGIVQVADLYVCVTKDRCGFACYNTDTLEFAPSLNSTPTPMSDTELATLRAERDAALEELALFKSKMRGMIEGFEIGRQWYLVSLLRGLFNVGEAK